MSKIENTKKSEPKRSSLEDNEEWAENLYNEGYFTGGNFPPINESKVHYIGYALVFASIICFISGTLDFNFWFLFIGVFQLILGIYLSFKKRTS